ncbi:MAG: molybdopterin-dependent oxidoreductase, partial [Bacillota bacterium]|nr:molybdopterin-dependent oxidoreductase [Bacillota bacterium]
MRNVLKMKKTLVLLLCIIMAFAFAACGGSEEEAADADQGYTVDAEATTLTIAGNDQEEVVYTAEDLQAMDTVTNTYSGRNKKVENARQFETYTGVEVNELLKDAGFDPEGAILTVTCSDGYTKDYAVADLYGLYAFTDNETDNKAEVVPIFAVIEPEADAEFPSPFRLIFGQADYDNNEQQDFNMQG